LNDIMSCCSVGALILANCDGYYIHQYRAVKQAC
jgi:hypothetical protein